MDEVEVDAELTARRKAQPGFVEASFPTIAGTHSLIFHNVSTSLFFGVKLPKFVCAVFKNWEKDQRPPFLSQQPQKFISKSKGSVERHEHWHLSLSYLVESTSTSFTFAHHFSAVGAARSCEEANVYQCQTQHRLHALTSRAAHALLVPSPPKFIHPRLTPPCLVHRSGACLYQVDTLFDTFRLLVQWSWLAPRP